MRSGGVCHRRMKWMRRLFGLRGGLPRRCASSRCGWPCSVAAPRRFRAGYSSDRRPDTAARLPPGRSLRTSARGSAGSLAGDAASSGSRRDFHSRQNSPWPFPISSVFVYRRQIRVSTPGTPQAPSSLFAAIIRVRAGSRKTGSAAMRAWRGRPGERPHQTRPYNRKAVPARLDTWLADSG